MSTPKLLYDGVSKWFLTISAVIFPPYFFYDAPFGRFSPSKSSRLLINGIASWIVMEIVSPLCFLAAFLSSPLTRPMSMLKDRPFSPPPVLADVSLSTLGIRVPNPPAFLALMFLGHYLNRALISPLRTPVRSKSHIIVPVSAILFNVCNGSLMGAFLAALSTTQGRAGLDLTSAYANWTFWGGVGMWTLGFASNIWHDEVLLNLRRTQKSVTSQNIEGNQQDNAKPHYAIPYGGLYTLVSYPNYFSEWMEWLGYAIASSVLTAKLPSTHVLFPFTANPSLSGPLSTMPYVLQLTPPWIFFISVVLLTLPRAWNGHKWYHKNFPNYPRERKAVVPYLL